MGGSVTGGNSYMVGENGPEVVTMGGSGVVTPSSVGGGGMSVVINDQTTTSTATMSRHKKQQALKDNARCRLRYATQYGGR